MDKELLKQVCDYKFKEMIDFLDMSECNLVSESYFAKIGKTMEVLNWKWYDGKIPTTYEHKKTLRTLYDSGMKSIMSDDVDIDHIICSCGGWTVTININGFRETNCPSDVRVSCYFSVADTSTMECWFDESYCFNCPGFKVCQRMEENNKE